MKLPNKLPPQSCIDADLDPNHRFVRCQSPIHEIIWCPTWISNYEGPMGFCKKHSETFHEETNQHHCGDGQFFYGDDAYKAFEVVEDIIPHTDERYLNARGMILAHRNATHWAGNAFPGMLRHCLYCVDGQFWLLHDNYAARLGNIDVMREWFPKLLEMPKRP